MRRAFSYALWLILCFHLGFGPAVSYADPTSFEGADGTVFTIIKKLGSGKYGDVYLVEKKSPGRDPEKIALKVYQRSDQTELDREAQEKLIRANGEGLTPHLLPVEKLETVVARAEGEPEKTLAVRPMKLADGCLRDEAFLARFKPLRSKWAWPGSRRKALQLAVAVLDQAAQALREMSALGIVDRDLKPENFMYVNQSGEPGFRLLLGDLDLARVRGSASDEHGSQAYVSPEIYKSGHRVNEAQDIYALACSVYQLIFGEPPTIDFLHHDKRKANEFSLAMLSTPGEHPKMMAHVKKRFEDLEAKVRKDPQASADLARLRTVVLSGLIHDFTERMSQSQIALRPRAPVGGAPSRRRGGRLRCWILGLLAG